MLGFLAQINPGQEPLHNKMRGCFSGFMTLNLLRARLDDWAERGLESLGDSGFSV